MFDFAAIALDTPIFAKLVIILLGSYILNFLARRVFEKVFKKTNTPKTRTVLGVLQNSVTVIILAIAILMTLSVFNINILPLLASAGILGFAVGFGSQSLIKDLISGIFLLTSDTFYEGDIVRIGAIEGKVEKVGIRAITLRDMEGVVHTIPNGTIGAVANLTREWSRANISIGVSTEHDIDYILKVFNEELEALKNDTLYSGWIIGTPKVEGIDSIEASKIIIKTLLKTNQAKKWDMEREFKYRIKKRFEKDNLKFA
jgi:small conductance mechanosensitive channel